MVSLYSLVKTAFHDNMSSINRRWISKIRTSSSKTYDPDASSVSNFNSRWIFHIGKKHDIKGNLYFLHIIFDILLCPFAEIFINHTKCPYMNVLYYFLQTVGMAVAFSFFMVKFEEIRQGLKMTTRNKST